AVDMALPPELFDDIIRHTRHHTPTILACALVRRSWLPSSRHHHFANRVVLLHARNIATFVELIASPHATIRGYVRHLNLWGLELSSRKLARFTFEPPSQNDEETETWIDRHPAIITALAHDLPTVESLAFGDLSWDSLKPATQAVFYSKFRALATLELRSSAFDFTSDVVELISSKPALRKLHLLDVAWSPDPGSDHHILDQFPVPQGLDSLRLTDCYQRDILDWMVSRHPVPAVRYLQLGRVQPPDAPSIGRFLKLLGPELKTLQFEFSSLDAGGDAESFFFSVDLVHNTSLHTISVHKFVNESIYQFSRPVAWILKVLSRAQNLTQLFLGITLADPEEFYPPEDPIDWTELDCVLSGCPKLRMIIFCISGQVPLQSAINALTGRLPQCAGRGQVLFRGGFPP
ncbi:unnamed protein product, partial [Mycena citricolor]